MGMFARYFCNVISCRWKHSGTVSVKVNVHLIGDIESVITGQFSIVESITLTTTATFNLLQLDLELDD